MNEALIDACRAGMDLDGFLSPHGCLRCGKPLHGQGTGYPAELYLGTYTGLCYPCTSAPAYAVETLEDGAQRISYPPSCPSHRRDRALYTAYAACRRCQGRGVISHSSQYGSYPGQCPACAVIAYGSWRTSLTEWRQARLQSLTDQFEALLRSAETRRRKEQLPSDALFLAGDGERYRQLLRTAWSLDRMP